MKQKGIKKMVIKGLVQFFMLVLICLVVVALTSIPRNLKFELVNGSLTHNFDGAVYQEKLFKTIKGLLSGEVLAQSIYARSETVGQLLVISLKRSMILFFGALLLAVGIGLPKGIFDSRRRKTHTTLKLLQTLVPLSIPDVLLISLVQLAGIYLYRQQIRLFGVGPIMYMGNEHWSQYLYPMLSLALVPAAYLARVTAGSIESVYHREYILAARGKGCSETRIILTHLMPTILADLTASFPKIAAMMFSSLFLVERIFYFKGIGYEMLNFYGQAVFNEGLSQVYITFAVGLAILYFILYTVLDTMRQVVVPKLRNE